MIVELGEYHTKNMQITYAGGATRVSDLDLVAELSHGNVDLTFGSALDIFGGKTVAFLDCVDWNTKKGA